MWLIGFLEILWWFFFFNWREGILFMFFILRKWEWIWMQVTPVFWPLEVILQYVQSSVGLFHLLLLGCAVDGHPTPNITWLYSGKPLSLRHRFLAAGRILQILNISDAPEGEFSCLAQNEAGSLLQKTSLAIQGNFPISVLLSCEAFDIDFPALPFLS